MYGSEPQTGKEKQVSEDSYKTGMQQLILTKSISIKKLNLLSCKSEYGQDMLIILTPRQRQNI